MPAKPFVKIDPKTRAKAVAYAIRYRSDPNLGAGKFWPSTDVLQKYFGENLTLEAIRPDLPQNLTSVENPLAPTQEEIEQAKTDIENNATKQPSHTAAAHLPTHGVDTTKQNKVIDTHQGHISAEGVIEEAAAVLKSAQGKQEALAGPSPLGASGTETIYSSLTGEVQKEARILMGNQSTETAPILAAAIQQKVEELIPQIAKNKISPEVLKTISAEISKEATSEILEKIGSVPTQEQIPDLVADATTQTIIAHPDLENNLKIPEEKIFEKLSEGAIEIATSQNERLQKAAVLGRVAIVLKRVDENTKSLISEVTRDSVEVKSPLMQPAERSVLSSQASSFVTSYQNNFSTLIAPTIKSPAPNFDQLTKAQNSAYQLARQSHSELSRLDLDSRLGFILGLNQNSQLADSHGLGFAQARPFTFARHSSFLGKGVGILLGTDRGQDEGFLSLLAQDKQKLTKAILENQREFEKLNAKKARTLKERKAYLQTRKKLSILVKAREYGQRRSREAATYQRYFYFLQGSPNPAPLTWASQTAWTTTNLHFNNTPGHFLPQSVLSQQFLARRAFGGMGYGLGDFIKMARGPGLGLGAEGMGMAKTFAAKGGPQFVGAFAAGYMKKLIKGSAAALGLMGLYFLKLGMAALAGFMAGATIGFGAGAVAGGLMGFQIGLALAPFTFGLSIPFFTVLGALGGGALGAAIMGFAGGLIGYGLASGSATAVSTGIGAGVGGAVGAGVGGTAGFAIGSAVCGGFVGCGFVGAYVGGTAGAIVGAFIGGAIGYGIGKALGYLGIHGSAAVAGASIGFLIAGPVGALIGAGIGWLVSGGWHTIANFLSGGTIATSAAVSGFFGGIASLGSTIGSAIGSVGSSILSGISGGASAIGSLGSSAIAAGAGAGAVVGAGVGSIAVFGIVTGIVTSAAFSTANKDKALSGTGDNAYFTVTKIPEPDKIANSELANGKDVKFTINLKAKVKLHEIALTDEMSSAKPGSAAYSIPVSSPPCSIDNNLNKDEEKSCDFTVNIKNNGHKFDDELITNTVSVSARTEDSKSVNDYVQAYVLVGNAQAPNPGGGDPSCPNTWPFTPDVTSYVTQGPLGATDHAGLNLEAIDLGVYFQSVVATVDGTLLPYFNGGGGDFDNRVQLIPDKVCGELQSIWYYHMANVTVEGHVTKGQTIGTSGDYFNADICIDQYGQNVCGPHLHYQFNDYGREFPMQIPYIPKFVKPDCNDSFDCGVLIP